METVQKDILPERWANQDNKSDLLTYVTVIR